jgi:hypothetical protein
VWRLHSCAKIIFSGKTDVVIFLFPVIYARLQTVLRGETFCFSFEGSTLPFWAKGRKEMGVEAPERI